MDAKQNRCVFIMGTYPQPAPIHHPDLQML